MEYMVDIEKRVAIEKKVAICANQCRHRSTIRPQSPTKSNILRSRPLIIPLPFPALPKNFHLFLARPPILLLIIAIRQPCIFVGAPRAKDSLVPLIRFIVIDSGLRTCVSLRVVRHLQLRVCTLGGGVRISVSASLRVCRVRLGDLRRRTSA